MLERWKALSLSEQAILVLVAWLLWGAMGLAILVRAVSPQAATDALALRQLMDDTLPHPRDREGLDAPGRDPWHGRWCSEERWDWGWAGGIRWRWEKAHRWYQLVPADAALATDERWSEDREDRWRAVTGPRVGAFVRQTFEQVSLRNFVSVHAALYSAGPNGRNEGGAGDDVFAREPGYATLILAWHRETSLVLVVLLVWLIPWIRSRRSPRLAVELGKALVMALPAIGVIAWLLAKLTAAGGRLELAKLFPAPPLVPWQFAVGGSFAAAAFVGALTLRLSRLQTAEVAGNDDSPVELADLAP